MGKHERIAAQVSGLDPCSGFHPCYLEYFRLFNAREYYAAHDVLEHIWLGSSGQTYIFYKGLIQFAGGFVHLSHHHREPGHRVHGRRLRPAARLFLRSAELLEALPLRHEGIEVHSVRLTALAWAGELDVSGYRTNPWSPESAPRLDGPS
jgi:predicted metal-dependent hydrolase